MRALTTGLLVLALSCGGQALDDAPVTKDPFASSTPGTGLPCDVEQALQRSCWQCHGTSPTYGAPMPLTSYDALVARSVTAPGKKVYELLKERVHAATKPMPPPPNLPLAPAELAVLDAWVDARAPRGPATCDASYPATPGTLKPLSCTPDARIRAATPWTMPARATDEYVCYGLDVDLTQKRHVVGLAAHVDNTSIVHHVLLFQSDTSVGPTPKPCGAFGSMAWRLIAGWAPGATNLELPPEAGFPEDVGKTHWVVQVHYNNLQHREGQVDESGYDLCTTEALRANDADVMAFGAMDFRIPARSSLALSCEAGVPSDVPLHLFSSWPHMHTLGTHLSSEHISDGSSVPRQFVAQPKWSFDNQVGFAIDVVLNPSDRVRTHCAWDNPSDRGVNFGEDTADEMCFNFVAYYPKVPMSSWALPSVLGRCTPEVP